MEFKDILVYLDDGKSNDERIKAAFALAQGSSARLTAVTLSSLQPSYLKTSGKTKKVSAETCAQDADKRASDFLEKAKKEGLEASTRIIHRDKVSAAQRLAQVARNFDLVILRQANPDNSNFDIVEEIAEKVLLFSGRPIFFMPYIGAHRIPCENAMIAWDGTPTATRAVHDALPILKNIGKVIILIVRDGKKKTASGELLADDLLSHLQRHGVNASIKRDDSKTIGATLNVQEIILNEISDSSIDLLVMGGYGTPSLKQKVFGGVTQSLLLSMVVPVIMSH